MSWVILGLHEFNSERKDYRRNQIFCFPAEIFPQISFLPGLSLIRLMMSIKLHITVGILLSSPNLALPVSPTTLSDSNALPRKNSISQNSNSDFISMEKRAPIALTLSHDHRCIPEFDLSRVLITSSFNS